jgi:cyclic pyranopterin phosphate synthase
MMGDFSHLNAKAEGQMVDVSAKQGTPREARVRGIVTVGVRCGALIKADMAREIAATARVAGVMAAKKTCELIPFCHQINLSKVDVSVIFDDDRFVIETSAKTQSVTGVEMEAFVAALNAGATVYDMIKAVAPDAVIGPFMLMEKRGGKTGLWKATSTTKSTAKSTRRKSVSGRG